MVEFHHALRRATVGACLCAAIAAAPAAADPNNNNSEKLRSAVTLEGIRAHQLAWQHIADLNGGNRFAGLPGHDASAEYVADKLREAGYDPTFQTFTYEAFVEKTTSQLERLSPSPQTFVNGNDFRIMQYSGSGDVTAEVATPSGAATGCASSDFAGFPAGKIALVSRGTCTFRLKTDNATAAGASAILIYNHVPGVLNGTLGATGLSDIPSLGLTRALGQVLLGQLASGSVTMRVVTDTDARSLTTRNVFAETASGDPENVVMVGGHLDSVNAGPGINDNGSGSAAVLETAIQMAKVKPRNKVRFAWWSAEESGLIGSTHYVNGLSANELGDIALYLNFDMVGSPNFARFVYDGDNSTGAGSTGPAGSDVIERVFYGHFEAEGLPAEPTPFNGRSDYGPFIAKGVPAGGLFTGAEGIKTPQQAARYGGTAGVAFDPCYHASCDTFDNNSDVALDTNADAIAHTTITFAQNTSVINGVRGKGNFQHPALGANDGGTGGAGGGGGLHDDHEVESR